MNGEILCMFHNLESVDGNIRKPALERLIAITDEPVDYFEDGFALTGVLSCFKTRSL